MGCNFLHFVGNGILQVIEHYVAEIQDLSIFNKVSTMGADNLSTRETRWSTGMLLTYVVGKLCGLREQG